MNVDHTVARAVALALALLLPSLVRAQSLGELFASGNAAFARGEYEPAVRAYEALIEAGIDDPDVCFNLASAYGSLGRYGQAIRYFEKTLRLAPRDEAAKRGLKTARDALGERQALARGEAIVVERPPLNEAIFAAFSAQALAGTALVCAWLAVIFLLLVRRLRKVQRALERTEAASLALGIASAAAAALSLVSLLGLGSKTDWGRAGERAIILSESTSLREGPDERARLMGELVEGESVRVLARESGYARVMARGERVGYVRDHQVGEI